MYQAVENFIVSKKRRRDIDERTKTKVINVSNLLYLRICGNVDGKTYVNTIMKTLFTFFVLIMSLVVMGQSNFDQRLLSRYSEERVQELLEKQPSTIEYWTYYLDHSYTILDGEAMGKTILTDEEVKIKDLENFNVLDLEIYMDRNKSKTFKIKGTNHFLLLKSDTQFSKEFSNNRSKL